MNFEQAVTEYLEKNHRTTQMRGAIQRSWAKFVGHCQAHGIEFESLAPVHVDGFLQALQWEPGRNGLLYSANTVDQILRSIRWVLRWATSAGHLRQDPSAGLVLSRPPQPTIRYLSWEEVQAILRAPDRATPKGLRDAAMLCTLVEGNLEVKECLALNVGDQARLPLEIPTRDLVELYVLKARPLWLRPATNTKCLFLNPFGGRLSAQSAGNALQDAARVAGLAETPSLKCLRRSYWAGIRKLTDGRLPSPFNRKP